MCSLQIQPPEDAAFSLRNGHALVISSPSTENVVLHPLHPCSVANVIVSTLNSHQVHKQVFVHCISAMLEKNRQMENKEHYYENRKIWDLKTHEHVNLTMSSQSKLCFGEDSSKQTWRKRDHCTVCRHEFIFMPFIWKSGHARGKHKLSITIRVR